MINKEKYLSDEAIKNIKAQAEEKVYRIESELAFATGFAKALNRQDFLEMSE